jgi:predicted TIM-barrel fold metal-dependent hydrolase
MRIFDAHCHIYPAIIAQKAAAATAKFYEGLGITLDGTVQTLFSHSGEITMHLVQSVATTQLQVHSVNNFIAREVAQFPDRLYGFGTLHQESSSEDIRQILDLDLHGVKLHPDIQRFELDDPRIFALCEELEANNLTLLIHTGDDRFDFSNPNRLILLLRAFPKLKVIGAHFGGHTMWQEAARQLAGNYENLWVDCSSSFFALSKDEARNLIHAYGADRVLFGTDYPMWSPKEELKVFRSLELDPQEEQAILWDNAARLFNLPE